MVRLDGAMRRDGPDNLMLASGQAPGSNAALEGITTGGRVGSWALLCDWIADLMRRDYAW